MKHPLLLDYETWGSPVFHMYVAVSIPFNLHSWGWPIYHFRELHSAFQGPEVVSSAECRGVVWQTLHDRKVYVFFEEKHRGSMGFMTFLATMPCWYMRWGVAVAATHRDGNGSTCSTDSMVQNYSIHAWDRGWRNQMTWPADDRGTGQHQSTTTCLFFRVSPSKPAFSYLVAFAFFFPHVPCYNSYEVQVTV